jgi:hypothetical protein
MRGTHSDNMADSIYFPWAGLIRNEPRIISQRPVKAELKLPMMPSYLVSNRTAEAAKAYTPNVRIRTSHKQHSLSTIPVRRARTRRPQTDFAKLKEFVVQQSSVLTLEDVEQLLAPHVRPRTAPAQGRLNLRV